MDKFYLEILSPERQFYAGDCLSIVIPISDGMIGIMAHHTPLTAAIMDGEVIFTKPDGQKVVCAVTRGMADVANNRVRLLCESALAPDEIDEEMERRRAAEAILEMKKKQGHKDFMLWQLSFNKAVNNLKIKNKDSKVNL